MALRMVEVQLGAGLGPEAEQVLYDVGAADVWSEAGGAFGLCVRAVVGAERTGGVLDALYERLRGENDFRVLVTPLDAVLPRPVASDEVAPRDRPTSFAAVSREEVYAAVQEGSRLTPTYLLLVLLATLVAAIGLVRNNTPAVIGAMVVAPLLGPNMGIALGFTLGDRTLLRDALRSSGIGVVVAFVAAVLLGLVLGVDSSTPELSLRTDVALTDMLLALAAGAAGTVAYTSGAPAYLVGVMVAVALLPPTVAAGLFVGGGQLRLAWEALLLMAANVAAVTFAAMAVFRLMGMRPRDWWREEQARASARFGLLVFAALGSVLAVLVVMTGAFRPG